MSHAVFLCESLKESQEIKKGQLHTGLPLFNAHLNAEIRVTWHRNTVWHFLGNSVCASVHYMCVYVGIKKSTNSMCMSGVVGGFAWQACMCLLL